MADDVNFLLAFTGNGGDDDFYLAIVEAGLDLNLDFYRGPVVGTFAIRKAPEASVSPPRGDP